MKRFIYTILLLALAGGSLRAESLSLCGSSWQVKQERGHNWYPATVPGTVHTDLMVAGIIGDPFVGFGERAVQWVDKENWIYRLCFDITPEIASRQEKDLCFDGLDTYADVTLNGKKILHADNMFRRWRVDVGGILKSEGNVLEIKFFSPIAKGLELYDAYPVHYRASNDQSENGGLLGKQVSIFTRKAGYHYGWDWGPRIVTSGIWRDVRIEAWDKARINEVFYHQISCNESQAVLEAEVEIIASEDIPDALVRISAEGVGASAKASLKKGTNKVVVPVKMRKPKLWWSAGLGEPYLYSFNSSVEADGGLLCAKDDEVGIRSIRLVREDDRDGTCFRFELNGRSVFMKGANYIPCDLFLPRVGKAEYERTVGDAAAVGMNMLRVWGGGIYEDDYFYKLCDRAGILVWQDFMFSCSIYPWEGALRESALAEAEDNVRRLRNHPCIALWCGNNECNSMWYTWGEKKTIPRFDDEAQRQLIQQYHHDLPAIVEKFAPGASYTPTSPWMAEGSAEKDPTKGDIHYWKVWSRSHDASEFETYRSRFFSEYGFQSFAGIETVRQFAPDSIHWDVDSEMMLFHQRGVVRPMGANARMVLEMERNWGVPAGFEGKLYLSQLIQGEIIRNAMEFHRRCKPYCWGTLVWQLNDCWPVASWAGRDWYGTWKAQQYFCRAAFSDILPSVSLDGGEVGIWLVSDRMQPVQGKVEVSFETYAGSIVSKTVKKVSLAANSSVKVMQFDSASLGADPADVFVRVRFTDGKGRQHNALRMLTSVKDAQLPKCSISTSVKGVEGGYEVTVSSDKFAKGVWLNVENGILQCGADGKALAGTCAARNFSDNFFDLPAGESRTVTIESDLPIDAFRKALKVRDAAGTVK